ncbi:uncharacterized protein NECHADRAFT_88164 [Fusarium vanettenii 77-13-4]|uniref:Infection structure specific protein n=1 Tax=Fusarium vanettenii (strain ATCC MYA-4622 / CBS 123669 / FGSC 9596 / NRRL 45880 / 77-13-4) TaxID=660122 RepID=C7ZDX3_FUSV7|nr:uncharacterized protein NECHADRAFT_88164 [Fusarium vanettenii 77-13-4]EEU37882.1 hypothetical protein NECHADRAFT_88164 [Fusarium vanettenii 77-13-4]
MRLQPVVSVLFASAFAQGTLNPNKPRDVANIKPPQTAGSAECATIFEPLVTGLPSLPPDFISFWSDNNPRTKGCLAQPPSSLKSQFASVYDDFGSWISSNEDVFSSIASKCPQYNFNGSGAAKRASFPAAYTELSPEAASWLKFATASGIPPEWAAYGSYSPCPAPAPATTSTVEPTTTPVETGSTSIPSAVLVNGGDRSMARPVYFVAAAGMVGAAVAM